jgi:hypothetical protein
MWLTVRELCNELHIHPQSANTLRRRGKLPYINLGSAKHPNFRYQLPPHTPAKIVPEIERVAFLTYDEVGSLFGISRDGIRKMMTRKHMKGTRLGKRSFVTVQELRRVLAIRDQRSGQAKQSYSPILMKWLNGYLESKTAPVEVLSRMIEQASAVPDFGRRSSYISQLWDLFDRVNVLLAAIQEEQRREPEPPPHTMP